MAALPSTASETGPAKLTTLLVSYNTESLLAPCLGALEAALRDVQPNAIIAVDNASRDGSVARLEAEHPRVRLIRSPSNVGFGRANNLAVPYLDSPYVLLLNTDAFVPEDGVAGPLAFMEAHPDCGILGVRLVGRDGVLQPSCRYFPTPLNLFAGRTGLLRGVAGRMVDDMDWDHAQVRECDWVPGCYYLVRREVIEQVGLFDPRFFLYYEEVDHCLAARRAGWKVMYYPDVSVVHIGGESAKSLGALSESGRQLESLQLESGLLYFRKNHGLGAVLAYVALDLLASLLLLANSLRPGRDAAVRPGLRGRMGRLLRLAWCTGLGRQGTR
ncbi:MAG TPA: glycosyltransferase family 2 protein [Burkholderiaceae bacterium]